MIQTYDNYFKAYYRKNKKKILARQKETNSERLRKYYLDNKEAILEKRRLAREAKKCQAHILVHLEKTIKS